LCFPCNRAGTRQNQPPPDASKLEAAEVSIQAVKTHAQTSIADRVSSGATPLALWHLLSLDAPTVATLWTWFVARCTRTALAPAVLVAMFLAVWLLYATDRLLDTRRAARPTRESLEARHLFHQLHRRAYTRAVLLVSVTLVPLIIALPRLELFRYLGLAALLVLWFVLIHTLSKTRPQALPKELALGPFFAAAVFIPSWSTLSLPLLFAGIFFALLCTQNCLYIYSWEHQGRSTAAHITTRLGVRFLTPVTIFGTALPIALMPASRELAPLFLAISLAAALLLLLDRAHLFFDRTHLRAAADLVLLTPLLVAPFLR
jgi:hypothetical protein